MEAEVETATKESTDLPTGWRWQPLGEVADNLDNKRKPVNAAERETRHGNVPYYGATGQVGWIDKHLLDEEVVLVGEDGAPFLEPGRAKAYMVSGKSWVNNHAHVLRAKDGMPNAYLMHFLNILDYAPYVSGTTRLKLTKGAMGKIPIPVAPLPEQRRIVSAIETQLGRLDAAVARLHAAKARLKRYKQAVLFQAFGNEDWQRIKLVDAVEKDAKILYGILQPGPDLPDGVPYVRPTEIENDEIDLSNIRRTTQAIAAKYKRSLLKAGDVILSIVGTIGKVAVVPDELEGGNITQSSVRIRPMRELNNYFLAWYLRSPHASAQYDAARLGTAVPRLNVAHVRDLRIPVPSMKDQLDALNKLERIMEATLEAEATLDAQLFESSRLRQAVLKRAFEGRLVAAETPVIQLPAPLSIAAEPTAVHAKKSAAATNRDRHFARMLLSAEVVHQMHNEPQFNDVKHQKVFQLCEYIAQIPEIEGEYKRWRAGAFDNRLFHTNLGELKKQKWYDKSGARYVPMARAGTHEKYLSRWSDKMPIIQPLLDLLKGKTDDQCEIFATAYFAWNDLILWGREATEDTVFDQVWNHWHESKRRFSEERWRTAIRWIKGCGYAPTGFGKATCEPT